MSCSSDLADRVHDGSAPGDVNVRHSFVIGR
jgi:hypothetical protein